MATTELPASPAEAPPGGTPGRGVSVLVVGAGFGGLAAAVALSEAGVDDVTVVEQADRVGGVWRDNTYPGAACDVPSSLYSWSFAPNPDWPRRYAQQPDILRYIERTAAELGLLERVRLGTQVESATWQASSGTWHVAGRDRSGAEVDWQVDVIVPAVGQLSRPALPRIPGLDSFAGPAFHSAQWDHGVDLSGKRVAVLGTGASAIQFVPEVQKVAAHVTVFQRSAPHVVPKPDRAYTRTHLRAFRRFPRTQGFGRELTRTLSERFNRALTEQTPFTRVIDAAFRLHLRHQVKDRELRRRLTPDYPIGCKRVLFSNDWYPALVQPHVEVVTDPIREITPEGVRTVAAGGATVDHEADVVIYGTGFAATEFLAPMRIVGRDGCELHDYWAQGAHAFLGVTVPHFPNMFVVYGPNTNLGGSSIISMIECQTGYLAQAVRRLAAHRVPVEVREDASAGYDREVQERLAHSVWSSGCVSWYQTEGGRVTTNWPGTVQEYRERTETFDPTDYLGGASADPA